MKKDKILIMVMVMVEKSEKGCEFSHLKAINKRRIWKRLLEEKNMNVTFRGCGGIR
jgi:hypothetical protein